MKHIPNILSASRIAWCLPLLLVDAMTVSFWVLYVIAGTTDMLDGFLARRFGVESKFGARLDSLADFVFVRHDSAESEFIRFCSRCSVHSSQNRSIRHK